MTDDEIMTVLNEMSYEYPNVGLGIGKDCVIVHYEKKKHMKSWGENIKKMLRERGITEPIEEKVIGKIRPL
jgi:hypothetical protein